MKKSKSKILRLMQMVIASILVVCLTACAAGNGNTSTPNTSDTPSNPTTSPNTAAAPATEASEPTDTKMGGTFHRAYGMLGDFWQAYKQGSQVEYCWPALEPLAKKPSSTLEWKPWLAESWEVDPDAFTLTVHLRDDVHFSDGTPFTADDAVFSLEKRLEYGTAATIGNPVSIEKIDDYTFVVTWDTFSLDYENWILIQYMYSKKAFDEHGADWMANNILGTGPYVLEEYTPDVRMRYVRNENYWYSEIPPIDSLEWIQMPDVSTQVAAFMNGEIDSISPNQPDTALMLIQSGYTPVTAGGCSYYYAVPVTADPDAPLSNVKVRQAIFEHAIDWDTMAYTMAADLGQHFDAIGMGMPYWNEDLEKSSYDPELAKKELAEAGYPDGFDTSIYVGANSVQVATVLQDALKSVGITAEVVTVDNSLIEGEYIGAKAIKTGIVLAAKAVGSANQMDRFNKFWNPTSALYGAAHDYSDEAKELWEKTRTARSEEEQNQYLHDYVDQIVHGDSAIWSMYVTPFTDFSQEWLVRTDDCKLTSGTDPFEMWIENH